MVSRMMRWVPGWVQVEAEGGYPERLLNAVTVARISVWGVRRRGERLRFSCLAGDYRGLRPMARKACVRMRVRYKRGLPFWRHRYRHRKGLLVGLALYLLVLAWLSPRIWVIEVSGNTVTSTEAILAAAAQRGVVLGARMDAVDVKGLQIGGTKDMPTVSFITVNPSYNVARIEVIEREESPPSLDLSQPSDMVALRDGRILRMEVYSGQKLVREGEAVTAGTRLVTGRVETELGEKLYRSYGEIWAETRRQITISVPLTYDYVEPTGEVICQPTLHLFCWQIPLYSNTPLQAQSLQYQAFHYLTIKGTVLPLGVVNTYVMPAKTVTATRTEAEAQVLAEAQLAEKEAALFAPDSYEETGRQGRIEDGVYLLCVEYLCRENIAVEVPLEGELP